jgi:hypothetical protein
VNGHAVPLRQPLNDVRINRTGQDVHVEVKTAVSGSRTTTMSSMGVSVVMAILVARHVFDLARKPGLGQPFECRNVDHPPAAVTGHLDVVSWHLGPSFAEGKIAMLVAATSAVQPDSTRTDDARA